MGTTSLGIPYPASTDLYQPDVDIQALATEVDTLLTAQDARLDALETVPAWASYTPAWSSSGTAPAVGNGTITGAYTRYGSLVHVRIVFTLGSTSTVGSGVYRLSLPVGAKANSLLTGMFVDASAGSARYGLTVQLISTSATGDNMRMAIDGTANVLGATAPVVPATGDIIMISGTYEAN